MRSEQGFSLVEVMTGVVVLGIVISAFIQVMHLLALGITMNNQNEVITNIVEKLNEALADNDDYCTNMLGGLALNPANKAGQQLARIARFDLPGKQQGTILTRGKGVGSSGLTVQDIRLVPLGTVDAQTVVAQLQISFRRANALGPSVTVHRLPIHAIVNAGRILTCSATAANTAFIKSRACEIQNDGWATYDAVKDTCVDDPRVRRIIGPPIAADGTAKASCPGGYVVAVAPEDPAAIGIGCDIDDTGSARPGRTYTDGSHSDPGPKGDFNVVLDLKTNSCLFSKSDPSDSDKLTSPMVKCVPAGAKPL